MKPLTFMTIAGEASGDLLAAELVEALRAECATGDVDPRWTEGAQPLRTTLAPRFFGAGGPHLRAAGVALEFDLTRHAVVGFFEVLRRLATFRRLFRRLLEAACERQPEVIVCVDFSGFNRRFGRAVQTLVRRQAGGFRNWRPRLVQYVSPQVWASRPGRAYALARDFDLLLSIFPFEPAWYARRVPGLRVEFVGHPIVGRHGTAALPAPRGPEVGGRPSVVLLPGSRPGELRQHLPVLLPAARRLAAASPVELRMVLPDDDLAALARAFGAEREPGLTLQVGRLPEALAAATLALACTGTVTLECACFGVPTVAFYRTSWGTYQVGRRLVEVPYLAMPNLLANEALYPEFIQDDATPENLVRAALELLGDAGRRDRVRARLREVMATLGPPGAARRAARAIRGLLATAPPPSRA